MNSSTVRTLFAWSLVVSLALAGSPSPGPQSLRLDRFGDALPEGALVRLGTIRLRHGNGATLAFLDNRSLVSFGGDRIFRYWDLGTGRLVREQQLPAGLYGQAGFLSPDGRLLAFQESDARDAFSLWDVTRNQLRHVLPLDEPFGTKAAFSPDSKKLITAQFNGTVRAWDVVSGAGTQLGKHKREINTLSYAADGTPMTLSMDSTIRFWDIAAGREKAQLTLPESAPGAVSAGPRRPFLLPRAEIEGKIEGRPPNV